MSSDKKGSSGRKEYSTHTRLYRLFAPNKQQRFQQISTIDVRFLSEYWTKKMKKLSGCGSRQLFYYLLFYG
ncbi:hypothetical protein ACWFPQ_19540 [Peribacillus butanolivorans]|uniref:hypothetical protein n=1 Tax=Peribacillus butanolivorans TaxID=421767 RepID=UPI00366B2111